MRTFLLLLAFCLSTGAQAVTVKDLYRGQVSVDARSEPARQAGIRAALAQVLVRITGDETLLEAERIQAMLRRADRFLLSYGYGADGQLQVDFDGAQIRQSLQGAELPLWGAQRPQTLLWLASEEDGVPALTGEADALALPLSDSGVRRGVPLWLPMLDLEDSLAVEVNDVWGAFPSRVLEASARYGSDFVGSARLEPDDTQWRYSLTLYEAQSDGVLPRPLLRDQGQAGSREAALDAMVAALAKYYAGRYAAIASADANDAELLFELPAGLEPLIALERYLQSLTPVRAVTVVEVGQGQVRLRLDLIGGMAELEQLMGLNPAVTPLDADGELSDQRRYRWSAR